MQSSDRRLLAGLTAAICLLAASAQARHLSVDYQADPAHTGNILFEKDFSAPLKLKWSRNLGGLVSYPVVAHQKVFVTVTNSHGYGTQLFALNLKNGATVWQKAIDGTYFFSNATYDRDRLFVLNYDGLLQAFSADNSGTQLWSVQLADAGYTSPPTARDGTVFVGGAFTSAIDASSGALRWTTSIEGNDHSAPTIHNNTLYLSYSCDVYALDKRNGQKIWSYNDGCSGGGGKTSVIFNDRLYVRGLTSGDYIFDSRTGDKIGQFSAWPVPTFWTDSTGKSSQVELVTEDQLQSVDVATGTVNWTFAGDGQLDTAPLLINGLVIEGSNSGNLYLLDGETGTQLWSTRVGQPILPPDEQNAFLLTGLGAGGGTLLVPASNSLVAYVPFKR